MRLTGNKGLYINRNLTVPFVFEGKEYTGFEGDTIASALIANDELLLSRSFKYHRPRGVLTMSGHDANSLVQVADEPSARADRYEIEPGLIIEAQNIYGSLKKDRARVLNYFSRFLPVGFYYKAFFWPKGIWNYWDILIRNLTGLGKVDTSVKPYDSDKQYKFCDIAIIGAGPAGLAAAIEAGKAGVDTILVDENKLLGGSLNYARFDADRTSIQNMREQMVSQVEQNKNITVYGNSVCTGWFADNYLTVMCKSRMLKIRAKHVIAATGMFEQPIVFRNNDLPGVMMCSAIQRLINLYGVSPGSKALIATTSSDGYATALDLIEAGIEIAAIVDYRKTRDESGYINDCKNQNIAIYQNYYVDEVISGKGKNYISSVKIKTHDNKDLKDESINIDCDFIGMSGGYSPAGQLICHTGGTLKYDKNLETFKVEMSHDDERSSIAGSLNNYTKLDDVINDGKYAAYCSIKKLGLDVNTEVSKPSILVNNKVSNFASPIIPHSKGKDFIDFDEDLQVKDIINAIKDGYDDLELVKRYSTVVMGPSQGRHSALNNARLVFNTTNQPMDGAVITTQRPPYYPEYIQHLAGKSYQPVKHTAIHRRHEQLLAKFFPAGTWLRPAYYQTHTESTKCIENEYLAIRNNVGLIDVSTLGKIEVYGADAAEFLERMYTSNYKKQKVGRSKYVLMTDKTGAIIDDGVACRLSEHHFYVTTTSSGSDNVYRSMLLWNAQWNLDVCITNVTTAYAAINLAGPNSRSILQKVVDDINLSASEFKYMDVRCGHIQNIPARLVRVGFVGELGYEIHIPYSYGEMLWDILLNADDDIHIQAVGIEAQRLLRLEKGHIIVGQDSDGLTNPYDVNMGWAISKSKPFFIGQRAIEVIKSKGINKSLVGFKINDDLALPEECNLIISDDDIIGRVTSVSYSPMLRIVIGLALISSNNSQVGENIKIKLSNGTYVNAVICPVPFYDPNNERQLN